jgi:hypothetical protein
MLSATSDRSISFSVIRLLVIANVLPSLPILFALMMEEIRSPQKRQFLQEQFVISQKTAFFNRK